MDFSKFKPSDWLLVAAGAIMLIFGIVLDWAKVGSVSGNGPFDYFFTGGISWLLVVAAGVIAFLLAGRDHEARRRAVVAAPGARHRVGHIC